MLSSFENVLTPVCEGAHWLHHSNRNAPETVANYSGVDFESNSTTMFVFSDHHWVKRTGQAVERWF